MLIKYEDEFPMARQITPQSFRRNLATIIYENMDHGLEKARAALGHKSVMTTEKYLNRDKVDMKSEVEKWEDELAGKF